MRNLIKFENFSMGDNNMMSREEMTQMLCNNGYSVEECNDMSYAEICKACDVCRDMKMAQTYEAKKSASQKKSNSKAKEMTYAQSGLEKPELADRNKNKKISKWEQTVATNIEKNIKKQSAQDGQVQTFSQSQKAQAQKPKAQSQKPKARKTTKRK
jgi:hypothetical protein